MRPWSTGIGSTPTPERYFGSRIGPSDLLAVGVGAVEHHDRAAERGAGVHHAEHRDVVGVEADTHVLHIDQQHVERAHRLVRRPELPSVVEREDRDARGGIHAAAHRFARIGRTAEPVLGGEDAPHVEARIVQHIDQMHAPGAVGRRAAAGHFGHGRMIGQHRHAPSAQQRIVGCRVGHADQHFLRPHGPARHTSMHRTTNRFIGNMFRLRSALCLAAELHEVGLHEFVDRTVHHGLDIPRSAPRCGGPSRGGRRRRRSGICEPHSMRFFEASSACCVAMRLSSSPLVELRTQDAHGILAVHELRTGLHVLDQELDRLARVGILAVVAQAHGRLHLY